MLYSGHYSDSVNDLTALYESTFSSSEGPDEGRLIGRLARALMTNTPREDIFVFSAWDGAELLGCIIFSRLTYSGDQRSVFVLGPVAVATARQGRGLGRGLIQHGLKALSAHGVDICLTYGDPGFYGKVGYQAVHQDDIAAPYPLQFPHGWLGQSLNGTALGAVAGTCSCVEAFNDPRFW